MVLVEKFPVMKSARDIHVCVIGAGVCGLVSVKACLDSGFKVTCFDKSSTYGGLWCYRDNKRDLSGEFVPSVMKTTILNTSKELSAFSDFPPPAHLPNFMRHNLYMDYIKSYVEHFKILPHLRLEHEIVHCEPEYDQDTDEIQWCVDIKDIKDDKSYKRKFDKLMVAVGHHNIPYVPSFPDEHKFKGDIIHTVRVKDILCDERFVDKNVLVVGFGNSACDAANDLAIISNKCYVSSHRGNWFISRLAPCGLYDFEAKNKWNYFVERLLPTSTFDKIVINKVKSRTNHELLGLTPKHKPSEHIPAINDLFPYRIFTGGVSLKGSLIRFTEDGVIFEGEEDTVYKVDIVILATGYVARVPFLNEFELGLKSADHDEYELYLNIFAPKLSITGMEQTSPTAIKSLAFIGLVQPSGSITVISELQARLATLVFDGKCDIPSVNSMVGHVESVRKARSAAIRSHSKDQLVGNWIGYSDEIADKMGAKPNLSRLFFKDFTLWKHLMFGPSVSYQYRLTGPGSWNKARETILTVNDRVYQGINEGKNHILFQSRRKCLRDRHDKKIKK